MSSHREAPEISKDPVADNTDVYAFVTPDAPDTVTLIANFIPFQTPWGGPNFFEFGDDVLYEIRVSNGGDGNPDVRYQFRFTTQIRNKNTFLYNTGPIKSIHDTAWNRPQFYSVTRIVHGKSTVLARDLAVPPVNVGIRSTPNYGATYTNAAVHSLGSGRKVFAGQRSDPFYVDLGSIFDLGALRPFEAAHLIPSAAAAGVNGLQGLNVHTIALQVPITDLTSDGKKVGSASSAHSVVGIWAATFRQRSRMYDDHTHGWVNSGAWRQVSRLGNPLFNEVIVPMAEKDVWNRTRPANDVNYVQHVLQPELAGLLPVLYPKVFPNLGAYKKPRIDLAAILLSGIPTGVVPGFQNFTGKTPSDMLRLNMAIKPTSKPNSLGLIGGDPAGFPNGRRLTDDVVTVELRAIAGATIPLVDPSFKPDAAAAQVQDGTTNTNAKYLSTFPYVADPAGGYQSDPGTPHA